MALHFLGLSKSLIQTSISGGPPSSPLNVGPTLFIYFSFFLSSPHSYLSAPFFFRMPPPQPLPALPASPQPHYYHHHHHHQAELQTFLPLVPAARSGVAPHLALSYHAVPPNAAMARRACGCGRARRRGELSR
jgi:hypothetical protein